MAASIETMKILTLWRGIAVVLFQFGALTALDVHCWSLGFSPLLLGTAVCIHRQRRAPEVTILGISPTRARMQ